MNIRKTSWANGWLAVEISPYTTHDFEPIVTRVSKALCIAVPNIRVLGDIVAADFVVEGVRASAHLDVWDFSIAAEREELRDRIYSVLLNSAQENEHG
jgi:hypothetical protein